MARNLTSTFYAPDKITVVNLDSGAEVKADVIEYKQDRITAAIAGVKIILNKNPAGKFIGKMAGMTLAYSPK